MQQFTGKKLTKDAINSENKRNCHLPFPGQHTGCCLVMPAEHFDMWGGGGGGPHFYILKYGKYCHVSVLIST